MQFEIKKSVKMMTFLEVSQPIAQAESLAKSLAENDTDVVDSLFRSCVDWAVQAGTSILMACLVFFVGRFLISLLKRLLDSVMQRRQLDASIQSFIRSFVSILLTVLLVITVISVLGINTTSFAALLASAGVAFGMALSGNLQNLAGGVIILLFKPYKVGDFIEAQGVSGTVKEIQIFHTIITTADNKEVFIPNGSLSSGSITNYNTNKERRMDLVVGVEYGENVEHVRAVVLDLLGRDERILSAPEPFVGVEELSASSVDLVIRIWVKSQDYWNVYYALRESVYEGFNEQGIGFPYPQMTLHQA